MSKIKIFVAGHKGMVGSAIIRCLLKKNKKFDIITKNRNKLDLTNQQSVKNFFKKEKIDQIYLTAAKVGGILANSTYPASFIYENLMIEANIINSAFESGVKRLLFFGSSCIYPKFSNQPIKENDLLTGSLEPTNEPYSIAKIAGIKLCESYNRQYGKKYGIDYRSIMPTNLYGKFDNFSEIDFAIGVLVTHINKASKFLDAKSSNDLTSSAPSLTIFSIGLRFLLAITKRLFLCLMMFLAIP